jgi:threonyl-tRNA synthetase
MHIKIGGSSVEFEAGIRVSEILRESGAFAAQFNGRSVDLSAELRDDGEIIPLTFDSEEGKQVFWHSASHLLAQAVKELFPRTKLAIGPAIENGFYYDFDVEKPFSEDDLKRIEAKMQEIAALDLPISHLLTMKSDITGYFKKQDEIYKVELLSEIPDEEVSIYQQGDFIDLCRGPHLPRTGLVGAVKLLSVAGAYWRGDEHNRMLQRIYGIAFPNREMLELYLARLEEAKLRDHRKIGASLEIFSIFDEAGAGLAFFKPKGTVLRQVIEDYWTREHRQRGYQIVSTPHIAHSKLFKISGHYDFYRENMYTLPVEEEEYVLKPMNCPGHMLIYKSAIRSYRELPFRLAELGTVYRNERSGVLHGLLRVRGFTIDDAHIFCMPEQIEDEVKGVVEFALKVLADFGFKNYRVELSLRDPKERAKYMGTDEEWLMVEGILRRVLDGLSIPFRPREGEAVFYGPKIDIKLLDALDRPWQATTVQFDFNLPKRFDLSYMGKDGQHHPVYIVHRAILGSLERFIGALLEHYGGALPVWLSPYQAVVLSITEAEADYGAEVAHKLIEGGVRAITDFRNEKIGFKISESEREKIPFMLVVGKKEKERATVSVRRRGRGDMGEKTINEVQNEIRTETLNRR